MDTLRTYVILAIFVSAVSAFPSKRDTSQNYRLPKTSVPIHYHIKLTPYIAEGNFTFDGECIVDCMILNSTTEIVVHSKNLDIDESFTSLKRNANVSTFAPANHVYDETTEMLTMRFSETLNPGPYTLSLKFTGVLGTNLYGFYRSSYFTDDGNTVWLAATHFQPTSARLAFPCWDEPALKATFNVSIKHNSNYAALSNMPAEKHSELDGDGKMWTHFQTTPTMSTNILAFVVADYDHVSNEDGTVNVWCRRNGIPHAKYFLEVAQKAAVTLEEYMNSTVRVPKMDHVAVPDYSSRATENWGMIAYGEHVLLHNESLDPPSHKEAAIMTGVHELAHMWFGNIVSPSWWKYLWMSEGFATYFKYYITDKIYGDWRLNDQFIVDVFHRTLLMDSSSWSHPMNMDVDAPQNIRRIYSPITYSKASVVLRMLSLCVTEDVFRAGLIKYVERCQYSAVTPDDLWEAIQIAVDEYNAPKLNFNVKAVMDTWTEQKGFPIVNVTRDYATGEIKLTQEWFTEDNAFRENTDNPPKWWIPLNFATQSNPNFSSTVPMMWLRPEDSVTSIYDVNVNDWIILNVQNTGYYRVNYDAVNWRRIAKYLNSKNYTNIHEINRAQIIDDSYNLLLRENISRVSFLEIINYLERETAYIPWQSAFNILKQNNQFLLISSNSTVIKSYMLHLMSRIIETIGFEEHSSDDILSKKLRSEVKHWACKLGHTECRSNATAKLAAHLDDPILNKLTPDTEEWTFCMGLRNANELLWTRVLTLYENAPSRDLLRYLGCTEDPVIVERFLNMIIAEDSPILRDHALGAVRSVLYQGNPSNINVTLNFIVENMSKFFATIDYAHDISDDLRGLVMDITPDQRERIKASPMPDIVDTATVSYWKNTLADTESDITRVRHWIENGDSDNFTEMSSVNNNAIDNAI